MYIKREDVIKAIVENFSDGDDSHWNAIATYIIKDIPSAEKQDGEDYLRGYQDGWVAHETISKSELHIDKPRGYQAQSISDGRNRR